MGKTDIVISDWQILFREGTHFTLAGEEDFEVIGEATDSDQTLALIEARPPDIAILNVGRDRRAGIDAACRIKRDFPSVAVILTDDSYSEERLFAVVKSGANACMYKDATPEELVRLVRLVNKGAYPVAEALLGPGIAALTIKEFETSTAAGEGLERLLAHLTPREMEMLRKATHNSPARPSDDDPESQFVARSLENIRHKLVYNQQHCEVLKHAQAQLAVLAESRPVGAKERHKTKKD